MCMIRVSAILRTKRVQICHHRNNTDVKYLLRGRKFRSGETATNIHFCWSGIYLQQIKLACGENLFSGAATSTSDQSDPILAFRHFLPFPTMSKPCITFGKAIRVCWSGMDKPTSLFMQKCWTSRPLRRASSCWAVQQKFFMQERDIAPRICIFDELLNKGSDWVCFVSNREPAKMQMVWFV